LQLSNEHVAPKPITGPSLDPLPSVKGPSPKDPSSSPPPVATTVGKEDDEDGVPEEPEFDPDDQVGDTDFPQFPITHEIVLKDHTKVVSALALDPSGARIVSGSHDYDCKLWDFGGMDMRCRPFKTWEPTGSYYASRLTLSCTYNV